MGNRTKILLMLIAKLLITKTCILKVSQVTWCVETKTGTSKKAKADILISCCKWKIMIVQQVSMLHEFRR